MSKQTQSQDEAQDSLEELGLDDGDYGFIISADGQLKHLFTPEEFVLAGDNLTHKCPTWE